MRDRLNCLARALIFLLVKQPAYWFDLDPIRIPPVPAAHAHPRGTTGRPGSGRPPSRRPRDARPPKYGPHTRQVTAASRYGDTRHRRTHPRGRNPGDVWAIPTRPYNGPHFAAYPIDLPLRCIAAGCKPGGTVLDPFTGIGTTGLAALQLDRRFTGIELNPAFAALAAERLQQAATRHPDGNDGGRQ